ncbi:MAG: 4Fe-4S binding protein [Sedimentisphaerales bacterium]|nr:4Fe-4S binding protein [Sedimentisphaerales bacterium]
MVKRNIVKIDEEKCNGCGQCVNACAEGAIKLINGKAKLVSEIYCDGLGACIGHCPQDAITIEQREAEQFDEQATKEYLKKQEKPQIPIDFVCPGIIAKELQPKSQAADSTVLSSPAASQLSHWPVQLKLVSPNAPYFNNADLLFTADCVPFAMGDFHERFLKNHSVVVGCPKLDDSAYYVEKIAEILKVNNIKSLTVIHMEVPCCSGLTQIVRKAMAKNKIAMSFQDVTIDLHGNVKNTEIVQN